MPRVGDPADFEGCRNGLVFLSLSLQVLAPAGQLVSVEPMPLHYWDIACQHYMKGPRRLRWNRRVVQRHALHRDELGGGGRAKNVHNSNYFPTQRTITPNLATPVAREPVPAPFRGFVTCSLLIREVETSKINAGLAML
jgi:hypothetical protein